MKFQEQNLKKAALAFFGGALGYAGGRIGAVTALIVAFFVKVDAKYHPILWGALAGAIAGSAKAETGNLMEDVKARVKEYGKGTLNMTYIDKFAPEAHTKISETLQLNGLGSLDRSYFIQQPMPAPSKKLLQMPALSGAVAPNGNARIARMIAKRR